MKKLSFGCGNDIKEGWDNCDIQKARGLIYCDGNKFPYPFKDNIYEYILLREVLEYLNEPENVLLELWRIAKPRAIIDIEVPYCNNKGAQNDMQIKHYFSDTTFRVLVEPPHRIKKEKRFEIVYLKLIPTKIGKFMPENLRIILSLFIGGILSKVRVKLKIIK